MHEGQDGAGESGLAPGERGAADDPVSALEGRLGLILVDRAAALAALTHKSYVNEHRENGLQDNERLEFLGDAVIDLAVSHRLMQRFPAAREGDLSKMRAAVVDEQGLADMARALDLGSLLRLGRGEELTGGRAKASLLADAMEAVIAAVYQGQGLEAVLEVVDRFLGEAFARATAGTLDRDFKTQLQELAQSRLRVTPRYRVVAEHGPDHSKVFEVEMELRGEALGRGRGRSKKDAEQAAARLGLEALAQRLAAEAGPRAPCVEAGAEPGATASGRAAAAPFVVTPAAAGHEPPPATAAQEDAAPRSTIEPAATGPERSALAEASAASAATAAAPAATEPPTSRDGEAEPGAARAGRPRRRAAVAKRPARRRVQAAAKPARTPKKPPPRGSKGSARPARKGTRARR